MRATSGDVQGGGEDCGRSAVVIAWRISSLCTVQSMDAVRPVIYLYTYVLVGVLIGWLLPENIHCVSLSIYLSISKFYLIFTPSSADSSSST